MVQIGLALRRPQLEGEQDGAYFSVAVIAGIAGLVGITMVVMMCAEKKVNPNVHRTGPPEWTRCLVFNSEMNVGFGDYSEGIHASTPYHVIRERLGISMTDAARWTCPMKEGKHVFEQNRGHSCCIGVGSTKVSLTKPGRSSLVGEHSESWGLDLPKQRSLHFNKMQQRLYRGIPDRFFVYVDMDSGKIGFGDDVAVGREETEFFGYICHGIPKNKEMYLMISMCAPNEHVHVFYRGSAAPLGYSLLDSPSPLQISTDSQGNKHIVSNAAPPAYMAVAGDKQQGSPAQPQVAPAPFQAANSGNLQF
ncbi:spry domain-containing socs box protein 1 [Plakobranchus ocellatus]|uniref:Spry domain-containing socs box protein 1 n=1 Tax=Plakobranchus ocellatus TaxID=259542 RepID=A0AAV3ZCQ7_9GAST|nr:spry domain-containing socs box protein 1 [Plakobranchus ocellatus]